MKKTEWVNINGIEYPVLVDCTREEEEAIERHVAEEDARKRQEPPSALEKVQAQTLYTALMTDTLIEEE